MKARAAAPPRGELPAALRDRIQAEYGIDAYDADVIVNQGCQFANYYIELADSCGDGKRASNWVQQDVLRTLNDQSIPIEKFPISAAALAKLLTAIGEGEIGNARAKDVFAEMLGHDFVIPHFNRAISESWTGLVA